MNRDGEDKVAAHGVDGLYFYRRWLIATQNGSSPERVMQLELGPSLTHVVSSKVIDQCIPGGGDFTYGVVVGDSFYYIANSGWMQLDEHGNVKR